ncbi:histidine phosphotransferase family protein [Amaricoccus sp.]|uniref:histidine phosphotransferase family protein n=1 Tax=Amaricoccus sp. TaxID=1872485 RepID=UPI00262C01FF|nr:histidine phosphotransferase family protein [Amaricoccus sp.]HRO10423.1 histidine phosphotransferase family protein [Amaricoccus sp.]
MSAPRADAALAELVSARLCHDLISPMGAIGNGLELVQLAGGPAGPELALVNESLATALAKLRFYRVAFGPADPLARQSVEEAAQVTDAMFHGRFTVFWTGQGRDLARPLVRLAYLSILCLEKSLPMGGAVRVAVTDDAVALRVDGRRTQPPAELWAHVTTGTPLGELRSDSVQFPLLRLALLAAGHRLAARFDESSAEVAIALSPELAEARP